MRKEEGRMSWNKVDGCNEVGRVDGMVEDGWMVDKRVG